VCDQRRAGPCARPAPSAPVGTTTAASQRGPGSGVEATSRSSCWHRAAVLTVGARRATSPHAQRGAHPGAALAGPTGGVVDDQHPAHAGAAVGDHHHHPLGSPLVDEGRGVGHGGSPRSSGTSRVVCRSRWEEGLSPVIVRARPRTACPAPRPSVVGEGSERRRQRAARRPSPRPRGGGRLAVRASTRRRTASPAGWTTLRSARPACASQGAAASPSPARTKLRTTSSSLVR